MSGETKRTTDHDEIRKWVEERGGYPATVTNTKAGGEPGVLRIDFPGYSGEDTLEHISWEDFFEKFDRENLAFLYQRKHRVVMRAGFSSLSAGRVRLERIHRLLLKNKELVESWIGQ